MNNYYASSKKKILRIGLAVLILIGLFLLDLFTGPMDIHPGNFFKVFTEQSLEQTVFFKIRFPQSLTAICVGLSLGLCGAIMQTILDNPLASPFTLGISSSASFGASFLIILGMSAINVTIGSIAFSILSILVIYYLNKKLKMQTYSIILCGVATKFLFDALISLVQFKASGETLEYLVFWIFGSLDRTGYVEIAIISAVFLISYLLLLLNSWKLTAMRFGEERAEALGVNTKRMKALSLLLISLLTAVCVSFCGVIGFIGLSAPHIARKLVGEDQRYYITASTILGAMILLLSSSISKVIKEGAIIPIGIISSIIGIPFLIYAILNQQSRCSK